MSTRERGADGGTGLIAGEGDLLLNSGPVATGCTCPSTACLWSAVLAKSGSWQSTLQCQVILFLTEKNQQPWARLLCVLIVRLAELVSVLEVCAGVQHASPPPLGSLFCLMCMDQSRTHLAFLRHPNLQPLLYPIGKLLLKMRRGSVG